MQQDENSPNWQQPTPAAPAAPYESIPVENDSQPQAIPANDSAETEVPEQGEAPEQAPDPFASEADDALLRWQATEYVSHDRSALWFVVLALISLALIAVALFLMQSITFAILVPVMAAALVVYVRRPPALLDYSLSRKGIHINDRLYGYEDFRSFGVLSHENVHSVILVPRKRFQLSQTMYFPEVVGESLVDMLAARLPMQEVQLDAIDRFLARLHL